MKRHETFSSCRAPRVLAHSEFHLLKIVALFCAFAAFGNASQARDSSSIPPYFPKPTPLAPLSQAQVAAPPIDAKTARFHAAKLFNYGQVRAPAWVLIDADSGRVLAGRNARRKMFPASTTKTLTALVALSEGDLDSVIRVGPNPPQVGEQSIYLLEGEQFSLRDLLRAAMIKSANDACVAIAEGVAGTVPDFAARMNSRAKEAGATESNFVNPHGLHDANHFTTARDLALIARAAMRYPFFNEIAKARESEIHGNWKLGGPRLLINKNRLLFRWADCDGVKTGYTRQAGRCLISSATRKVRDASGNSRDFRLIAVVMNSPDIWSDSWFALQKLGFERFAPQVLARKDAAVGGGPIPIIGGASDAQAVYGERVELPLRIRSTRAENAAPLLVRQLEIAPGLKAPLRRGQTIGYEAFFEGKTLLKRVPLLCATDVPLSTLARVLPSSNSLPSLWSLPVAIALISLVSLAFFLAAWRQHRISQHERTRTSKRR